MKVYLREFFKLGVQMIIGVVVITRGNILGTLFQLDACNVKCNSSFVKVIMWLLHWVKRLYPL